MTTATKTELLIPLEPKTTPAVIEFDFDTAKAMLETKLEQFKVVVTEDRIGEAKTLKADINKLKAAIADVRKLEAAKATESVRAFEAGMKALEGLCADGYALINDQIIKFEQAAKERILGFLNDELADCWDRRSVEQEFRTGTVDHLAILTNANDAGMLTKKAKEAVAVIADADMAKQVAVKMRLLQLENECLKAGLKVPLSRVHVNGFLMADDETYARHLAELIAEEVERTKRADALFFAESNLVHDDERQEMAAAVGVVIPEPVQYECPPDKVAYEITVMIFTSVDPSVTPEKIRESVEKKFNTAGFKNIASISIERAE